MAKYPNKIPTKMRKDMKKLDKYWKKLFKKYSMGSQEKQVALDCIIKGPLTELFEKIPKIKVEPLIWLEENLCVNDISKIAGYPQGWCDGISMEDWKAAGCITSGTVINTSSTGMGTNAFYDHRHSEWNPSTDEETVIIPRTGEVVKIGRNEINAMEGTSQLFKDTFGKTISKIKKERKKKMEEYAEKIMMFLIDEGKLDKNISVVEYKKFQAKLVKAMKKDDDEDD